jgi:uncharacterized Zn-binding protein involved in type VI secretion
MRLQRFFLAFSIAVSVLADASAQSPAPMNGVVVQGSPDVSVGGAGVARQGDATTGGGAPVVQGSPDVIINGKPAATMGGLVGCGGTVVSGSLNVFVNGKPLARTGDETRGCTRP